MVLIFQQTLGIKRSKNADPERGGSFQDLFPSYQLGRDLKDVSEGKPLRDPSIYLDAINKFFSNGNPQCVEKIALLIETLESKGYVEGLTGSDISTKCDQHTIGIYKKLILDIWNHYSNGDISIYSMPKNVLDNIITTFTKYRLPVILEFYQQRLPDIIKLLKSNKPDSVYENLETEYIFFFKNVLEENLFYTLSRKERTVFFNTLYAISDVLDKIHHEDSYIINLELLTFYNEIYNDDYTNAPIDDIRRIQGCIYAISIENTKASLQGNIKLTRNSNLTQIKTGYVPFSFKTKIGMCYKALINLLHQKRLARLDKYFDDDICISLYENRLHKSRSISADEIQELSVLSLIYSNIATCTLQYIKHKIDISTDYNEYVEICETNHDKSRYIRDLVVRITHKIYGESSTEYTKALQALAAHFNSVATEYFYTKKYANSIAIRSVLYSFFKSLGLKDSAHAQLELAPIDLYECNGGNNQLYNATIATFYKTYKQDFTYLFTTELMSYDNFKTLVSDYKKFKDI